MSLDKVTVAKRYAKALFEILAEQNQLANGFAELKEIRTIFLENPELGTVLTDKSLTPAERDSLVKPLLDATSGTIYNLIQMVYDYGRMDVMVEIINQFQARYDDEQQTVYAEATTAVPLGDDELARLREGYAKRVKAKQVVLSNTVDEAIIGGVIVKSKDTILDGSIRTKLDRLRQTLLG